MTKYDLYPGQMGTLLPHSLSFLRRDKARVEIKPKEKRPCDAIDHLVETFGEMR